MDSQLSSRSQLAFQRSIERRKRRPGSISAANSNQTLQTLAPTPVVNTSRRTTANNHNEYRTSNLNTPNENNLNKKSFNSYAPNVEASRVHTITPMGNVPVNKFQSIPNKADLHSTFRTEQSEFSSQRVGNIGHEGTPDTKEVRFNRRLEQKQVDVNAIV